MRIMAMLRFSLIFCNARLNRRILMYKQNIVRILLFAVLAVMMAMPSFAAATPSKTLEQARKFYDLNLDTQAIDTLQGLIKTYPTDPSVNEANYWLGRCMARQSQFDKARTA